jgi:hypothetical protein
MSAALQSASKQLDCSLVTGQNDTRQMQQACVQTDLLALIVLACIPCKADDLSNPISHLHNLHCTLGPAQELTKICLATIDWPCITSLLHNGSIISPWSLLISSCEDFLVRLDLLRESLYLGQVMSSRLSTKQF